MYFTFDTYFCVNSPTAIYEIIIFSMEQSLRIESERQAAYFKTRSKHFEHHARNLMAKAQAGFQPSTVQPFVFKSPTTEANVRANVFRKPSFTRAANLSPFAPDQPPLPRSSTRKFNQDGYTGMNDALYFPDF